MSRSERKKARIERYNELADKAAAKSSAAFNRSTSIVSGIPAGQPILVGHHSEGRHRRALDRSWNALGESVRESDKADYYRRKAEAAENNNAIYTEDDDAEERLVEKIANLEKLQQAMKDRNKVVKSKKLTDTEKVAKLVEMGVDEKEAHALLEGDFCGHVGYPAYALTNNNATIRNAQKRLESVRSLKSMERKEYEVNGIRVVENPEENRFQIFFGYKPSEEIRKKLKNNGYRWSPQNDCWQCYLKRYSINAGKRILESLITQ